MKTHRVNELIELIHPEWQKDPDLNLVEFILKLAKEAQCDGPLESPTDDVPIYHLKMRNSDKDAMIPGIAKDCEDDFKTATWRARGIIKQPDNYRTNHPVFQKPVFTLAFFVSKPPVSTLLLCQLKAISYNHFINKAQQPLTIAICA